MATKVDIANKALTKIGLDTITKLDEGTVQARRVNAVFDTTLDTLLQIYPWNFAMERKTLALLSDQPEFEYTYQFQLPTNPYCLKPIELYDNNINKIYDWIVEGRKILCNESVVYLRYIKRVTSIENLSAAFVEMFACYLAREVSQKMSGIAKLKTELSSDFKYWYSQAKLQDSSAGTYKQRHRSKWISARNSV